jgi:ADP-ribose pyrophosphatase YjhB (NUDIX family)/ribosomal protein S27AE
MWQRRAKHCPLCAAALVQAAHEGRARVRCSACSFVLYENPAAASAGLVLDEQRRVLLVREVLEESGIEVRVLSLFDLIFVPEDLRRPANVAIYLCAPVGGVLRAGEDALEAAWFGLDALPPDLGFDNGPRILERLRQRCP